MVHPRVPYIWLFKPSLAISDITEKLSNHHGSGHDIQCPHSQQSGCLNQKEEQGSSRRKQPSSLTALLSSFPLPRPSNWNLELKKDTGSRGSFTRASWQKGAPHPEMLALLALPGSALRWPFLLSG